MSIESPKTPESEFPKYENLSENQKEVLVNQCGIEDSETFEIALNCEEIGREGWAPEDIINLLKQTLEDEK